MDFSDERWASLNGGYRRPYDARPALKRLAAGDASVWEELWEELHHQGDVGEASYAAVPEIVQICAEQTLQDWNVYALAAAIERSRQSPGNPAMPSWLKESYRRSWTQLETRALLDFPDAIDNELVSGILAVLALAKGKTTLARMALLTEDEREHMLSDAGWG